MKVPASKTLTNKSSGRKPRSGGATQLVSTAAGKPVMVIVLGMHRSGTSVTARLLECLGGVNSRHLMEESEDNKKGYFEDLDIVNFNEQQLLPELGVHWHDVQLIDWSRLSSTRRSKLGLQAIGILRKNYDPSRTVSILKDPRISVLLPFWLSVIAHAGFQIKAVCALRDPVSVARSLQKRDGFSMTHGGMMYGTYWFSILSHLQDIQAGFIKFDDIFVNPAKCLVDLSNSLSLTLPLDFEERIHEFNSSFLTTSERHHSVPREDVVLESDLPSVAVDLYNCLNDAAESQNIKITGGILRDQMSYLGGLNSVLKDFDRLYSDSNKKPLPANPTPPAPNPGEEALKIAALQRGQLAEKITLLEREKNAAQQGVLEQKVRAEELSKELETQREAVRRLHETLEQERLGSMQAAAQEAAEAAARCDQLTADIKALEAEIHAEKEKSLQERESSARELAGVIAGSKEEILKLQRDVEQERMNAQMPAKERGELAEKITILEGEKNAAQQDLAKQKGKTEELIKELETQREGVRRLEESLKQEKLHALELEKERELQTGKNSSVVDELNREIAGKETEISRLADDLQRERLHAQKIKLEGEQAHFQLEKLEGGMAELRKDLEIRKEETQHLENALTHEKKTSEEALRDRNQLAGRLTILEEERKTDRESITRSAESIRDKAKKIEELEWYLGEHKEEVSKLRSSLEKSHQLTDEEAKKREHLEKMIRCSEEEKSSLQRMVAEEKARSEELAGLIQVREKTLHELQDEIHLEKQKSADESLGKKKLQDEMAILRETLSGKISEIAKLSEHAEKIEGRLHDYIKESSIMAKLIHDQSKEILKSQDAGHQLEIKESLIQSLKEKLNSQIKESARVRNELMEKIGCLEDQKESIGRIVQEERTRREELEKRLLKKQEEQHQLQNSLDAERQKNRVEVENHNAEKAILRANFLSFQKEMRILKIQNKKLQERPPLGFFKSLSKKQKQKQIISESGWFDEEWYLDQYPDVRAIGVDPITHYLNEGAMEKRNPSPMFNTEYYLENTPEIAETGMNPLYHFIQVGIHEAKKPRP